MTNNEKLKEVFGKNFSIISFAIGPNKEYKSYGILTDDLEQIKIDNWLDQEYEEREDVQ